MRDPWYGDKRSLVKWPILLLLARKARADRIIQRAMLNESKYQLIKLDQEFCAIPNEVLSHFRNVKLIRRMVRQPQIEVFHEPFDRRDRAGYFRKATRFMDTFRGKRAVVFLDPETRLHRHQRRCETAGPGLTGQRPQAAGRRKCHTVTVVQKIAVTLDQRTVADLDRWVREGKYPNRSRALQSAVDLLSEREKRTRLARELARLDPDEEKRLAEEWLAEKWPEY